MSNDLAQRQSFLITPPRAFGQLTGEVCVLATSTTAGVIDMRTVGVALANLSNSNGVAAAEGRIGLTGNFCLIFAETADLGLIVGPTLASVTTTNAPNLATAGSVNGSGVYTNVAGTCARVPAGTFVEFCPQSTQDLFLGFVASAAGKIRIYQNSASNP